MLSYQYPDIYERNTIRKHKKRKRNIKKKCIYMKSPSSRMDNNKIIGCTDTMGWAWCSGLIKFKFYSTLLKIRFLGIITIYNFLDLFFFSQPPLIPPDADGPNRANALFQIVGTKFNRLNWAFRLDWFFRSNQSTLFIHSSKLSKRKLFIEQSKLIFFQTFAYSCIKMLSVGSFHCTVELIFLNHGDRT